MTSRSWLTICIYVVGLGIGAVLLVQHWVHVPAILPYLILLACPVMHLLMHRGHGKHHTSEGKSTSNQSGEAAKP